MINYVLNKQQINSDQLLNDIQNLINKKMIADKICILQIDIKVVSYDDTTMIPKIEHKQ
jgi:hypothetical protein